jgi:amidohydrolase
MKKITSPAILAYLLAAPAMAQNVSLVDTYKGIHAHPELSHHEEQTAALLAAELRKSGYTVTERVGKYPDGTQAYGVVGILENGRGPKLLIRADMDALPIVEETGVAYASQVKGVMHACGHDVHVATMIGTARALAAAKAKWHGTLMLVGQPSEETIDGAKALLADHLYERFGTPDLAIALHDTNSRAAGTVGVTSGPALTSSTSVNVVLRGIGAHGAQPQAGKDPIVMAGEFIVQLQTIVSRQENPRDPSIVTIGSIHGGTKRNIIPNEVKMEITARAYTDKARQVILDGIRRTAQGVALSAGVPEELAPIVTVLDAESTPVMYNDPKLTARVKAALVRALGAQNVIDEEPGTASEDFGILGLEGRKIPTMMFGLGAIDPGKFAAAAAEGKLVPGPHNSRFEPAPEPTLRTGVAAMSAVAIDLLK